MSSFPRQPAAEQRPASFQEFIGLERWTDADGVARVRLGHRPELMNYLQQFHGGVLMSVLDAAMAQAIRACLPDCSMVTIDMATHFMGSARGELRAGWQGGATDPHDLLLHGGNLQRGRRGHRHGLGQLQVPRG